MQDPNPTRSDQLPYQRTVRYARWTQAAGGLAVLAGIVILLGWLTGSAPLVRLLPSAPPVPPLAGAGALLGGLSIILFRVSNFNTARGRLRVGMLAGSACALALAGLGLGSMAADILGFSFGPETWLLAATDAVSGTDVPLHMPPAAALGFAALGLAMACIHSQYRRLPCLGQATALTGVLVGLVVIGDALLSARGLDVLSGMASVGTPTAMILIALGAGAVLADPVHGVAAVLTGTGLGSTQMRRSLPWVFLLPLAATWLKAEGDALGLYDSGLGLAMLATSIVVTFTILTWIAARSLNRIDARRLSAEQELRETVARLAEARAEAETSEECLRMAVDAGGIGTWHVDLVKHATSWSDTCLALFGLPPDTEMSHERFLSLVHPDDRIQVSEAIRVALDRHSTFEFEFRGLMPDGSTRWRAAKGNGHWDAQGRAVRMEGIIRDIDRRKQAEETALANRIRFENTQASARIGTWEVDLDSKTMTWSREVNRLLRWDPASGDPGFDTLIRLSHPDDHAQLHALRQALNSGVPIQSVEFRSCPERGPIRYFEVVAGLDSSTAHRIAAGTLADITPRKEAELAVLQLNAELEKRVHERTDELARATAQLTAVLNAATHVSIIATDTTGLITVFNRGAERMLGHAAADVIGRKKLESIHVPAELEARARQLAGTTGARVSGFEVVFASALQGGFEEREWTYVRCDGSHLTVSLVVTAQRDESGAIVGFLGLARDTTRQRAIEESLRLKSAALDAADNAVVITDNEGRVDWANPAFTRLTGYQLEEILHRSPKMLRSGVHDQAFYREMWETILAGKVWRGEVINRRKDGTHYPEEMTITPVPDADERVSHFIAVKQDITLRRKTEEDLRRAMLAAEQGAVAKSRFLAVMSHEIRTPINGISGMTNLLLDTNLSPKQRRYTETILTSAEALLSIINEILDFSKIEAGKLVLEAVDFDLRTTVEEALELLAPRAHRHDTELSGLIEPDVPVLLRGDPGRLRQILNNLISNAVKFTENGEISIHVSRARETPSEVDLQFAVTDTGIGIDYAVQQRLFQAFEQADHSTSRRYGGTGLGLAITKELVELMGGHISLRSKPGEGSSFFFTIRLGKQPAAEEPTTDKERRMDGTRVLVVDDRETAREAISTRLQAWGMHPSCTVDADDALRVLNDAAVAGKPFSLALIDLTLPSTDGLALARSIRTHPELAPLRLILLCPLDKQVDEESVRTAGFSGIATKPMRQTLLRQAIATVLDGATAGLDGGHAPAPAPVPNEPRKPAQTVRILLAEDNVVNQQVAIELLQKIGCTADIASNGREAVEAVTRTAYDIVLMDCMMPEMDGYAATMRIRKLENEKAHGFDGRNRLHIVAMTANALAGDRDKCLSAGMDDYLSKPVRATDLQQAIARWEDGIGAPAPADGPHRAPVSANPDDDGASTSGGNGEEPESPPVDLGRLADIGAENPAKLRRLIEMYTNQAEECFETLANAIGAGAAENVRTVAHKWNGASSQCGMIALLPPLSRLEQMGRNGELSGAADVLRDASNEWKRARQFLDFYLQTL